MAFTLEHVYQVRNGYPRQLGELPDSVWKHLGWLCPWVYLGQSGLEHIALEHPDITDFDLLWLPLAIATGQIVHVEKNPKQVLRSGADIYQALNSQLGLVDGGMDANIVESTHLALSELDARLAEEFLVEAAEYEL